MLDNNRINDDSLVKVVGGTTTEDCALNRVDDYPLFFGYTADGIQISITNYQGGLFDINGNEYRWTSFDNGPDRTYTILYFASVIGNEIYSKKVNASDNILSFLWSMEHFVL